jgi:hypothetical protein
MAPEFQAAIKFLVERAEAMQREVFSAPPADYAAFKERMGAWQENQRMQIRLAEIEQGIEDQL